MITRNIALYAEACNVNAADMIRNLQSDPLAREQFNAWKESQAAEPATIPYTYYWNLQEDEHGRNIAMWDGFTAGDPLCVAYRGEIDPAMDWLGTAELLWIAFNAPGERPADYRGPSMSIGSVVEFGGQAYAAGRQGFQPVDISSSEIRPADPRWIGAGR